MQLAGNCAAGLAGVPGEDCHACIAGMRRRYFTNLNWWGRSYDVSPDGQRFLMIKEGGADGAATPASIIVVQHGVDELERLVPTK